MSTPGPAQDEETPKQPNLPPDFDEVIGPCPARTPLDERDKLRVCFGMTSGAFVKGFPSKGGVYILNCSAIELDFLGLDRFETAWPSADPAEEDALCDKMRLLGPEEKQRFIGVTLQGGLWVLETDKLDSSNRQLGRIGNARDMEEKCRAIERFGGTFYADPSDCPLLDFKSPVPERAALQVLVVYHDAHNLEVMRSLLVHLGFSQVTGIGGGREALDYLLRVAEPKSKTKPDIILFDMELRASEGFDMSFVKRELPYTADYSRTIFIGMGENTVPNDAKMSQWLSVHAVLPRPVQERQLEQTLIRLAFKERERIWLSGSDGDAPR
ncbi:hypothetical protein B0I37DRAFT_412287 [Chaetomium sp. MPI-CAGE-AT-0009]|nr:hypothetical protein B0I37DRAFT_412287 [Chaetomium sp. MPI-CAGE-AT-0009]